jgi:hypothetical protein
MHMYTNFFFHENLIDTRNVIEIIINRIRTDLCTSRDLSRTKMILYYFFGFQMKPINIFMNVADTVSPSS